MWSTNWHAAGTHELFVPVTGPPIAVTLPLTDNVDDTDPTPAKVVSFAFSDVNSPVVSTVNANTAATTTKAIKTIAVSRPVLPLCSRINF